MYEFFVSVASQMEGSLLDEAGRFKSPSASLISNACRLEVGDTAGWKPALQSCVFLGNMDCHQVRSSGE